MNQPFGLLKSFDVNEGLVSIKPQTHYFDQADRKAETMTVLSTQGDLEVSDIQCLEGICQFKYELGDSHSRRPHVRFQIQVGRTLLESLFEPLDDNFLEIYGTVGVPVKVKHGRSGTTGTYAFSRSNESGGRLNCFYNGFLRLRSLQGWFL